MPVMPSEESNKPSVGTGGTSGDQGSAGERVKATAQDLLNKGPVQVDGE